MPKGLEDAQKEWLPCSKSNNHLPNLKPTKMESKEEIIQQMENHWKAWHDTEHGQDCLDIETAATIADTYATAQNKALADEVERLRGVVEELQSKPFDNLVKAFKEVYGEDL